MKGDLPNTAHSRVCVFVTAFWLVAVGLASEAQAYTVRLSWTASVSTNVNNYRLHYGTASGSYSVSNLVGNVTSANISGLQEGLTYYFALTSLNDSGLESVFSTEANFLLPRWQTSYFSAGDIADPSKENTVWGNQADPDHDGQNNLVEYALGLDPTRGGGADYGVTTTVQSDVTGEHLVSQYTRRKGAPGITLIPEVSADRIVWENGSGQVQELGVTDVDTTTELVTIRDATPLVTGQSRFFRVRAIVDGLSDVGYSEERVGAAVHVNGALSGVVRFTPYAPSFVQPLAASGTLTAVGTTTLTDANATWTNDQFNGASGAFYVEFVSGATFDITDTDAATHTLTVDRSTSGLVTVGETYRVRRHVTIADLFGAANQAGLQSGMNYTVADNVLIFNSVLQQYVTVFYFSYGGTSGWYTSAFQPAANLVIPPGDGLVLKRKATGDIRLVMAGRVKGWSVRKTIRPGYNLLGTAQAGRSLALSNLGLWTGSSFTGLAGGLNYRAADNLIVMNPDGSSQVYFYLTMAGYEGWYSTTYAPANSTLIPPGSAFYALRRNGASEFVWTTQSE